MTYLKLFTVLLLAAFFLTSCGTSSAEITQTSMAKTEVYLQYQLDVLEATKEAKLSFTPTPSPTPRNTSTPVPTLPAYCYDSATFYLDEVSRIYDEINATIRYWNNSARGDAELLEVELRIRDLLEQTEALEPPEDYMQVQEHFLAGVAGNLNAIFGITDQSDANREGSNRSFQEEFELAWEAWEEANRNRDRVCVSPTA
jgi:hypothetical protein